MRTSKRPPPISSGINGGRWTQKEHDDFLIGLELYGREWKKVAIYISTRTSAQIRSHAQKYFAKLNKDGGSSMTSGSDTSSLIRPSSSSRYSYTRASSRDMHEFRSSDSSCTSARSDHHSEERFYYDKNMATSREEDPFPAIIQSMLEELPPQVARRVACLATDEVWAVQVLATYGDYGDYHQLFDSHEDVKTTVELPSAKRTKVENTVVPTVPKETREMVISSEICVTQETLTTPTAFPMTKLDKSRSSFSPTTRHIQLPMLHAQLVHGSSL